MKPALLPVRNVVPSISAMVRPQPSPSAVTERDRTNISEPAPLRRRRGRGRGPRPTGPREARPEDRLRRGRVRWPADGGLGCHGTTPLTLPSPPASGWRGMRYICVQYVLTAIPETLTLEHVPHGGAERGGGLGDDHPGAAQCFHLVGRTAFAAGDDRAGMAHAPARRRGAAGDKADDRFLRAGRLQKPGAIFFCGAADFADHDDRLGLVVGEKHFEDLDEIRSVDRIPADADAARLPETYRRRLGDGLIGQGAGTRDDAD